METTVLFADITGSDDGYQHACVEQLCALAKSAGGRVLKVRGDEVLALFPSSGDAARAADAMHAAIDEVAAAHGAKLAVQVGLYSGDTVKLAARLLEEASRGETPTSFETTTYLGPKTMPPRENGARSAAGVALRLKYRQRLVSYVRENETVVIGRHSTCEITVADRMASRRHCTIEGRDGEFFVRDHSANGTWIYIDGEKGRLLKGAELAPLRSRGWIGFGPLRFADSDFVEFFCA
jgi:hypothetical protein